MQTEITNGREAAGGRAMGDTQRTNAASTNPRKGRTSAKDGTISMPQPRSSKNSVARKGGKASLAPKPMAALPSQNSGESRASGHYQIDTQVNDATRTKARKGADGHWLVDTHSARAIGDNGRKPRTAAISATTSTTEPPQSTNSNSDVRAPTDFQYIGDVAPHTAGAALGSPPMNIPLPQSQIAAITTINDAWRRRQGIVKAMTKLSLQAQASLRTGRDREEAAKHYSVVAKDMAHPDYPIIAPYLEAQEPLERWRSLHEKTLTQAVKTLPIYGWAKGVSGLGDVSLAGLIGECSGLNFETGEWWSIGQMKSVSAVWKRLGLAVMNGVRQGDATAGLSKSDWVEHGYVKTRRSVVWNIGECVIKAQWRKENTVHAYGKFYGEEKARLQALNEAGAFADKAAEIVERMRKAGSKPLAENVEGRLTASHINNRAKRHMTKRLLRDLYVEWRRLDAALLDTPKLQAA